jgi:putative ABC transport system permease protein
VACISILGTLPAARAPCGTGIVIGIAAVLDVVSVAEGARVEVSRQISSLGTDLLLVLPGAQLDQGVREQAGSMLTLTATDARALAQEIPDVAIAAPFVKCKCPR